jgi:hypothetical protein
MGTPVGGFQGMRYNQFERLQLYAAVQKPPEIKFKDLEAVVDSTIEYNTLPYTVDVQYVKITTENVLAGITVQLQNKDLVFKEEEGLHKAVVNIYGRITTVTRRLAAVFEDPVTIAATAAVVGLPKIATPCAGDVPARAGGEGHRRRDHEHASRGVARAGVRRRKARFQQLDSR